MIPKRELIVTDMSDISTTYWLPAIAKMPTEISDFFYFVTIDGEEVSLNSYDVSKMVLKPVTEEL